MSVRLSNLVKEFTDPRGKKVRAVAGVSLEVSEGELVTLLGPSGCGKTTTLRMVAGFEEPTAGEISIHGRDVTREPPHRRNTPMVFQSYALFPHLSVRENAAFGLLQKGVEKSAARGRVDAMAEAMGLLDLLDRSPHQLSGGQQQRVALLRALVTEPKVLLFDEPLSNLDAQMRVAMREEIRRVLRKHAITAIYVTHDQDEAMVLSDRIVVMEKGRVAQVGAPREVYARPASRFVASFLGEASFVPCEVRHRGAGSLVLDGPLGAMAIADPGLPRGALRATLVVRPESVSLAGGGSLPGRVRSTSYLGHEARYEVAVNGLVLPVRVANPLVGGILAEGAEVSVSIEPRAVHALAEDQ
ncbi:MAG: ABC transporter ATP-binding protein [Myxococcales bacterium]|nr:ABC transporter ATP-binding protein [Myxococcales bacterium]